MPEINIYRYETIDSTNTESRRLVLQNAIKLPAVIIAKHQSAGRGRQGKTFYSPGNTGLYMSVVHEYPANENDAAIITVSASLAVADAIESVTGISTGIKWVNDLYIENRKVCGILTESFFSTGKRYVIVGVGINISTDVFPQELSRKAGSLNVEPDCISDLSEKIASNIIEIFSGGFRSAEEYKKRSIVIKKSISYVENGITYRGTAMDITETGALQVRLESGKTVFLQSGEISLSSW